MHNVHATLLYRSNIKIVSIDEAHDDYTKEIFIAQPGRVNLGQTT